MLGRYQIVRGRAAAALPQGVRIDTRKHTRHVLRPDAEEVERYLMDTSEGNWTHFARTYRGLLEQRFALDRSPFDELAQRARTEDVYLGCNCPTAKNPRVERCHTWLALEFFRKHYPDLEVHMPPTSQREQAAPPVQGRAARRRA